MLTQNAYSYPGGVITFMSSSSTVTGKAHEKAFEHDPGSSSTSKGSEHLAFGDLKPAEIRLAEHQTSSENTANDGRTAIYFVWPVDSVPTASKEPGERIIEAIKDFTDRPEEIHNCLLSDVLVFAKASMTAVQANMLQDHPDVSAVVLASADLGLTCLGRGCI